MKSFSDHPQPQFERTDWQSLNGGWEFGFDKAARRLPLSRSFDDAGKRLRGGFPLNINVPFCPESRLSGIGFTGFISTARYRKTVSIKSGRRVFLVVGAADYQTFIYINGKPAGRHRGGYTTFKTDITELVKDGENEIVILCEDETRNALIPSGKQSDRKNSYSCSYTRTTGIWGSVWLEYAPLERFIKQIRFYPNERDSSCDALFELSGSGRLCIKVKYDGKEVFHAERDCLKNSEAVHIKLNETHLWEPGHGRLYTVEASFGGDTVNSYFGLRSCGMDSQAFLLNGKRVFQRLVLDQGYFKDGIYTAKNDEELRRDIELSMALGFNGARLHQKVFDPRFLYFCDLYGYLVWGEYASWGIDYSNPAALGEFLPQWLEAVERDFNHPSIIGWCPFNETWNYRGKKQRDELILGVYLATKAADPTRPCIDTSGNFHIKTDIYDVHDYRPETEDFRKSYEALEHGELYEHVLLDNPDRQKYGGEPVFISEYGGIKWIGDSSIKAWGYGGDVKSEEEFSERYTGLTEAITSNPHIFGFCYTQLYDVEQEQNGLYTYERKQKFSDETYKKIKAANTSRAAIEEVYK